MLTLSTRSYEDELERMAEEEPDAGLFGLFQVDLDNYMKIKFALMYHMQIPPEQIEEWPYWEYQTHVELLSDVLKKKQNAEKDSGAQQKSYDPQREAGKMMQQVKTPKLPSFKLK